MKDRNRILGDIELHDLVHYTKETLKAGAVPKFDGCKWILSDCCKTGGNGGGDINNADLNGLRELIQNLTNRVADMERNLNDNVTQLQESINNTNTIAENAERAATDNTNRIDILEQTVQTLQHSVAQLETDYLNVNATLGNVENLTNQNLANIENLQNTVQNLQAGGNDVVDFKVVEVNMTGAQAIVNDAFVTEKTMISYAYLNGDPAGYITTRVEAGRALINSTAEENGSFILLFVKSK